MCGRLRVGKGGVRYRYYVSHPVVQGRKGKRGAVARVPGPELEGIVVAAVRQQLQGYAGNEQLIPTDVRDLIERHVDRVTLKPDTIEIVCATTAQPDDVSGADQGTEPVSSPRVIVLP
jgi:hypothetical protein